MTTITQPAGLAPDALYQQRPAPAIDAGKLLRLKLIGPMEAWTAGAENVLPLGRKTRALLAVLALAAPRPVARTRLAELLWSRRPEEPARASLRQEVHRLVEALQPLQADVLLPSRDRLALNADLVWVDVDCVLRASIADPAGLGLLNGEVLEGFDGTDPVFDTWLLAERERIRDKARAVADAVLRASTAPEPSIAAAKQLLALDKAHEGAWRALMLGYTALGERGLAIQAFDQCRAALMDLLSANPSPETQRLVAEIRGGGSPARNPLEASLDRAEPARPTRAAGPKFGVLPFRLGAGGDQLTHASLNLAEEITAAMARFRWVLLVSASSLAQFGNRDEAALRRTFGLDFALAGSVQRADGILRVTVQLLDLRNGGQLVWTQRFDHPAADLSATLINVAADIAANLDTEILHVEARHAAEQPADPASAYELTVQALPLIARTDRQDFDRAGRLLSQALAIDPDYAAAHAWRAYWLAFALSQSWCSTRETVLSEAGQHSERALTLDPQDARALTIIGHVRAFVHQQPREALKFHERALVLNSNLPMAWGFAAITYTYLGDLDEATRRFERYQRFSPLDPNGFRFDAAMTLLALNKRDYEEAVRLGRRASQLNPGFSAGLKHYLSALGHVGMPRQAADVLARLTDIEPDFTVAGFLATSPFDRPADQDHYAEGLRRAGLA